MVAPGQDAVARDAVRVEWQRCANAFSPCTPIAGATRGFSLAEVDAGLVSTYVIRPEDAGSLIRGVTRARLGSGGGCIESLEISCTPTDWFTVSVP